MNFKYFIYQGVLLTKFLNFSQFFKFVNNKKKEHSRKKKNKNKIKKKTPKNRNKTNKTNKQIDIKNEWKNKPITFE